MYLRHRHMQSVVAVTCDGRALTPAEYTFDREHGWISVGVTPSALLDVTYTYSVSLDVAVSNWDATEGNYVYYNQLTVAAFEPGDASGDGRVDISDAIFTLLFLFGSGVSPEPLESADSNHDVQGRISNASVRRFMIASFRWTEVRFCALLRTGVHDIVIPCHNCHGGLEDIIHYHGLGMDLKFLGDIVYETMEKPEA